MKAKLIPVYFEGEKDREFDNRLSILKKLLSGEADFVEPVLLGSSLPGADAVIFPKLVREAYRQLDTFRNMGCPVIIATSEFGTVSMWDWEIASFLKSHRVRVFTPYSVELTRAICRALGLKTEMQQTSFLMFQDTPGEGMQASIFKRFFWWEEDCIRLIKQKFGIEITKKSFQSLGQQAQKIPDHEAEEVIKRRDIHTRDVPPGALKSAVKIYLAVKKETEADESIGGVGMNCLNESFYSDSTPCLAWSLLFEEKGLMWACEADIMSLLTKHLVYRTLRVPVMMSNIYPFLVGMAALKHERIDSFPEVDEPEHHLLAAHCGYLGVVPRPFAARWTLRPRVLEIVNENATAIDARLPEGKLTLVKIDPALSRIQVVEGELEGYVQYPGSDCRNGALIKIPNGYNLMDSFYSHHNCLAVGHIGEGVKVMARALGLEVDEVK